MLDPAGKPTPMFNHAGRFEKDMHAVIIADVPLDPRSSLYVQWGDWFGMTCGIAAAFCLCWPLVPRRG